MIDPYIKKLKDDLCEYFALTSEEMEEKLNLGCSSLRDEWNKKFKDQQVSNESEFYVECKNYIFDLALYNIECKRTENFLKKVLPFIENRTILDFGGGIGDFCFALEANGHKSIYYEICKSSSDFFKWRKSKYKANIDIVESIEDLKEKPYSSVFFLDVLEHIESCKFEDLINDVIHKDVDLIFCTLDFVVDGMHPMHLERNFQNIAAFKKFMKKNKFQRKMNIGGKLGYNIYKKKGLRR